MFMFLMDTFAWIWVIAIGATALLLAFVGLARVLNALAPVIGAIYILAIILAFVSEWPKVAVPLLLFAAGFGVYIRYFRRSPQKPTDRDQDASVAPIWRASSEPNGSKTNERLLGEEPRLKMPTDSRIGWPDYVSAAEKERMGLPIVKRDPVTGR